MPGQGGRLQGGRDDQKPAPDQARLPALPRKGETRASLRAEVHRVWFLRVVGSLEEDLYIYNTPHRGTDLEGSKRGDSCVPGERNPTTST